MHSEPRVGQKVVLAREGHRGRDGIPFSYFGKVYVYKSGNVIARPGGVWYIHDWAMLDPVHETPLTRPRSIAKFKPILIARPAMSEKFKVGDRVECVEAGSGCQLGSRGRVIRDSIGGGGKLIRVRIDNGEEKNWYPHRFRKISTNPLLESIYTYCRRELQP